MQKGMKTSAGKFGSLNIGGLTIYSVNILRTGLLEGAHLFEIMSNKALRRNKVRRS